MSFYPWFAAFCAVSGVLYTILIISFLNGWKSISVFRRKDNSFTTKVSVIVPFYNEESSLNKCIEGLLSQNIQTLEFEIILVDDQSTDTSTTIAKKLAEKHSRIKYLRTEVKGKKQALLMGIQASGGELIVTTDADCTHQEFWLANFVEYYELYKPNMIVGPVALVTGESKFQRFQQIEFVCLIASGGGAIGIGHPIMCNAANMAFSKSAFLALNDPFNMEYQSGDDVFLLHRMKQLDTEKIHFLKSQEAMVFTQSKSNMLAFLRQRIRWVSKVPGYNDGDTKFTAIFVFAASFLWGFGIPFMILRLDFWKPVLFLFLLKTIVDTYFFFRVSSYFKQKNLLKWVPMFELFYGYYVTRVALSLIVKKLR